MFQNGFGLGQAGLAVVHGQAHDNVAFFYPAAFFYRAGYHLAAGLGLEFNHAYGFGAAKKGQLVCSLHRPDVAHADLGQDRRLGGCPRRRDAVAIRRVTTELAGVNPAGGGGGNKSGNEV